MPFDRQTSLLWVGLIAVAAVFVAAQPKTLTREDDKTGKKAPGTIANALDQNVVGSWPGNGPLDAMRRFVLPPDERTKSSAEAGKGSGLSAKGQPVHLSLGNLGLTWTRAKEQAAPYDWSNINLTGYSIRFLIATVPDPVDSGLGYLFDQTLAAIQRGLEMDKYVIDQAWLPWKPLGADTEKSKPDPRLQENLPGLVLFRRGHGDGEDKRSLLAVLLVGETPTSGIHKTAFLHAAKIIRSCPVEAIPEVERERIRVIGPYFSGSSMSLRAVLVRTWQDLFGSSLRALVVCIWQDLTWPDLVSRSWCPLLVRIWRDLTGATTAAGQEGPKQKWQFPFIQVVCGAANGFDGVKFQQGWALPYLGRGERAFTTTVLPEALLRKWVYKYLDNPTDPVHGEQPKIMVILRESNTWFGRSALKESSIAQRPAKQGSDRTGQPRNQLVFMVPFPLHISQLRANYTKEQQAKLDSLGLPRSGRNLPLPQEERTDSGIGREGVQAQAPLMTGVTNDLILTSIVDTIAEKRAQYVGLIATDVRDKIFLADMIRERFPDVQLFTTGGDILFTHPDYNYALKGMIVGSTHPLHPLSQSWSLLTDNGTTERSERQRILFPNDASEGYYNAVRIHLTDYGKTPDRMMDYGWVEEYPPAQHSGVTSPSIWISAVGQNNQMVPLCAIPPQEIRKRLKAAPQEATRRQLEAMLQAKLNQETLLVLGAGTVGFAGAPLGQGHLLAAALFHELDDKPEQEALAQYEAIYQRPVSSLSKDARPGPQIHSVVFPNMWFLLFLAILVPGALAFRYAYRCLNRSSWDDRKLADAISSYQQLADFALLCIPAVLFLGTTAILSGIAVWHPDPQGGLGSYLASSMTLLLSEATLIFVLSLLFWIYFISAKSPFRWWGWDRFTLWGSIPALGMLLAVLACLAYFVGAVVNMLRSPLPGWDVLRFERWVHLANGVTPLPPLFLLSAALFTWGVFGVKKLYLANQFFVRSPFPTGNFQPFKDLNRLDRAIRLEIMCSSLSREHPRLAGVVIVLLALWFGKLVHEAIPPMDGSGLGLLALAGVFVSAVLVLGTLVHFYLAWRDLKKMLRFIALLPMADAFNRLPDKVAAIFGHYLCGERPRHSHLAICVQQYGPLQRRLQYFRVCITDASKDWTPRGDLQPADLALTVKTLKKAFGINMEPLADIYAAELDALRERDYGESAVGKTAASISRISKGCFRVLQTVWPVHPMEEAFGRPHPAEGKREEAKKFLSLPAGNPIREWAILAEDFVAIEVIRYVSQFVVQLRNLVTPLTIGSLLLVLAGASYSFVPQNLLLILLTALGAVVATAIVVFLVQVNRDELVSRITRSIPHQFTPDFAFVQGAATYVLPIVGALLIQFPFFTSMLRSFVAPLFHIIK
jgi:hypothetical protein